MLRVKKIYKSLVFYVVFVYIIVLVVYNIVTPAQLETVLTYENYTWSKLSDEVFVLSAFLETRNVPNSPCVRVITISKYKPDQLVRRSAWDRSPKLYSRDAFNVTCDVLSIDGSSVSKPGDHEVIIFDEKGELFAATYFNCPVRNDSKPHQVILKQESSIVTLPIKEITRTQTNLKTVDKKVTSVCVRALYGPYDNVKQMGQFISYYTSILGVSVLTFYLLDVSDRIKYFLGELQSRQHQHGLDIQVVDWSLDPVLMSWDNIWDYGALALLTDCVYHHMSQADYTYIVDMDEFIVPNMDLIKPSTQALVNLIGQFKQPPRNKSSDSFLFKNSFFCGEFNNETVSDPYSEDNFDVFNSVFREDNVWSYKLRAKMLIKTSEVVSVGHHMIYDWVRPNISHNTPVPEMVSLLHHYRNCEGLNLGFANMGKPVLTNRKIIDKSILNFEHAVKKSKIYSEIQSILKH